MINPNIKVSTASDDATIANAIGAFNAKSMHATMKIHYGDIDKETRSKTVAKLRQMAADAMQRIWTATAATRYHPQDPNRDRYDAHDDYKRNGRGKDDDGNDDDSDVDFECAMSIYDEPLYSARKGLSNAPIPCRPFCACLRNRRTNDTTTPAASSLRTRGIGRLAMVTVLKGRLR